jgi:hypothetical protein
MQRSPCRQGLEARRRDYVQLKGTLAIEKSRMRIWNAVTVVVVLHVGKDPGGGGRRKQVCVIRESVRVN